MPDSDYCPDCGTELPPDTSTEGLCPQCLMNLANNSQPATEGEHERTRPLRAVELEKVHPELVLGDRYQIRGRLGRGGMGEVWHAFDLKLRVEVALKSLRAELAGDELLMDLLRAEVRSAREVISPNVCRVFDLVVADDQELVSMEYIDGDTLNERLKVRGPLELREAGEIAAQFLAGLEAIHQAGLVHRDIKPENIMITRAGRVVVMDFGIAKGLRDLQGGTVSGTPAYMAPEQARGETIDARADVYSAGMVLAEMIQPHDRDEASVGSLAGARLRKPFPELPEGPWREVLKRALAWSAEERYPSAKSLSRALEEVTLRAEGVERRCPYPGLAIFTQDDAEYFFGRELEVESIWKKLDRPRLLAVIGPSGAGKSSFLRAGLLANPPAGWRCILTTPGPRPFTALAQALGPELAGDAAAVGDLPRFDEPHVAVSLAGRWRRRHEHALIVIDQFEELFTLNPLDIQGRFAELLGQLALEADVHVLVSMRDDFLLHCHAFEALAPLFSELTPLSPPAGEALRRALVQPALVCGYRFEDQELVDDMLEEIGGERGALPLLAFAAARMWERRNRDQGLLTRDAYVEIGGVTGALVRHAETTLERIGSSRLPIVREIFRNMVTAQGTRAVTDRKELLSVFRMSPAASSRAPGAVPGDEEAAEQVLDALIDARLLTTFESPGDESGSGRLEIIHESLLSAWPRLVHWAAQDVDNAQLRDQLRQSAMLWEERGRPVDLLWTDTSFREFELWRERYSGGLTSTEEAYAEAMKSYAQRRQRRRRLVLSATIAGLIGVVALVSSLWIRSRWAERRAIAEARRAEASKLFAVAQLEEDDHPTAALAYSLKSLELADSPEVRRFVVRTLWRGPTAFVLGTNGTEPQSAADFSPDGNWLLTSSHGGRPRLWASDGSEPRWLDGHGVGTVDAGFSTDSRQLATVGPASTRIWSLPDARELRQLPVSRDSVWARIHGDYILEWMRQQQARDGTARRLARGWPMSGAGAETLGLFLFASTASRWDAIASDPAAERILYLEGGDLYELPLRAPEVVSPERVLDSTDDPISWFELDSGTGHLLTIHASGERRIWVASDAVDRFDPIRTLPGDPSDPVSSIDRDARGRWLATAMGSDARVELHDLTAPAGTRPLVLRRGDATGISSARFHPGGEWLATSDNLAQVIWPLARQYPRLIHASKDAFRALAFHPEGDWLAGASRSASGGSVWVWPLTATDPPGREIFEHPCGFGSLDASPAGDLIVAGSICGEVFLLDPSAASVRLLGRFAGGPTIGVAFDRAGLRVAAGGGLSEPVVRVWNLETGDVRVLDLGRPEPVFSVEFTADGKLLAYMGRGLQIWDLESGTAKTLIEGLAFFNATSPDGRLIVGVQSESGTIPKGEAFVYDLESQTSRELAARGMDVSRAAWDPSGELLVTASHDGSVKVGTASGGEPHLLLGHQGLVWDVAVDPSGEWIASAGADGTVRLWPMPHGQPFHALPIDELLARLRSLTNYRVVEDDNVVGGYRLHFESFKGWNREPPTW